jgi:DNA-binding NarL/FixJ family response regulator
MFEERIADTSSGDESIVFLRADTMDGKGRLVSPSDRATLERWVRASTTPQRTVRRSRIALLLDEGRSMRAVAREVGVSRQTVALWRDRYLQGGCAALTGDRPGRGRKRAKP